MNGDILIQTAPKQDNDKRALQVRQLDFIQFARNGYGKEIAALLKQK